MKEVHAQNDDEGEEEEEERAPQQYLSSSTRSGQWIRAQTDAPQRENKEKGSPQWARMTTTMTMMKWRRIQRIVPIRTFPASSKRPTKADESDSDDDDILLAGDDALGEDAIALLIIEGAFEEHLCQTTGTKQDETEAEDQEEQLQTRTKKARC